MHIKNNKTIHKVSLKDCCAYIHLKKKKEKKPNILSMFDFPKGPQGDTTGK
jgi:hypothetical protein